MTPDAPTGTRPPWRFVLRGGRLCLDFANSVSGKREVDERDHIASYEELVSWGQQAGAITEAQGGRMLAEARRRPADAEAAFRAAIVLREAIYRVFLAFAQERAPEEADLEAISAALGPALAHRCIRRGEGGYALGWDEPPGALDAVQWPVVTSAAELLVSGADLERVRVCGLYDAGECAWLFVDDTKSHTRRWCSMEYCGNRAKARRHYQRAKERVGE